MTILKARRAPLHRVGGAAPRDLLLSVALLLHGILAAPEVCTAAPWQGPGTSCVISEKVGCEIDPQERERFRLFPRVNGFISANAFMTPDNTMELRIARTIGEGPEDTTYVLNRRQADELNYYIDNFEDVVAGRTQPRWYLLRDIVDVRYILGLTRERSRTYRAVPNSSGWTSIGMGASSAGVLLGAGYTFVIKDKMLMTIRHVRREEFNPFSSPSESVWDLSALVGIGNAGKNGGAVASVGLGLVGGVRKGERTGGGWFYSTYEAQKFSTIGIPLELQLFLKAASSFGIGVNTYVNLNRERSFVGFAFSLMFNE